MLPWVEINNSDCENLRIFFSSLELLVDLFCQTFSQLISGSSSSSERCSILLEVRSEVPDRVYQGGSVLLDLLFECLLGRDLRRVYVVLSHPESEECILYAVTHGVVPPLDESSQLVLHVLRELQFQPLDSKVFVREGFPVEVLPESYLPLFDLFCHMVYYYVLDIYITTVINRIVQTIRDYTREQ